MSPNVYAQSLEALVPEAKAQGLDIQIVEFTDWTTPNLALQSGDIDVNYFQHRVMGRELFCEGRYDWPGHWKRRPFNGLFCWPRYLDG